MALHRKKRGPDNYKFKVRVVIADKRNLPFIIFIYLFIISIYRNNLFSERSIATAMVRRFLEPIFE